MAGEIIRNGDLCGGAVIATGTIRVNGIPVAKNTDLVSPHGTSPHNAAVLIVNGTVRVNGQPIAVQNSVASCGHTCVSTQGLVRISGNG